jgi:hypothetical protein
VQGLKMVGGESLAFFFFEPKEGFPCAQNLAGTDGHIDTSANGRILAGSFNHKAG